LRWRSCLVKWFLSLVISKTDACLNALTLFISFLLQDLISLFTHENCIKSYLCGTLIKIILVWLFEFTKFLICLRAVLELFFAASFAPPQKITSCFC
jgi:hypothetical protein